MRYVWDRPGVARQAWCVDACYVGARYGRAGTDGTRSQSLRGLAARDARLNNERGMIMGMIRLAAHLTTLGAVRQRSRKQRVAKAQLDAITEQNRLLAEIAKKEAKK